MSLYFKLSEKFSLFYLMFLLFLTLQISFLSCSTPWLLHIPWLPLPHLRPVTMRMSPPSRALNSLGPLVSWGLGASSLTDPRPLPYMCWRTSYQLVYAAWLVVKCLRSLGSRLTETADTATGWPCSTASSRFSLIEPQGSEASAHWLGANICIWLFQLLVESFRGLCKHSIASVIKSGLGDSI